MGERNGLHLPARADLERVAESQQVTHGRLVASVEPIAHGHLGGVTAFKPLGKLAGVESFGEHDAPESVGEELTHGGSSGVGGEHQISHD